MYFKILINCTISTIKQETSPRCFPGVHGLHCHQHTGIFIPGQQRILPTPRLSVLDVRPSMNKVFMTHDLCQLPGNGTVDIFNNIEIGREEDIKVALMDLLLR